MCYPLGHAESTKLKCKNVVFDFFWRESEREKERNNVRVIGKEKEREKEGENVREMKNVHKRERELDREDPGSIPAGGKLFSINCSFSFCVWTSVISHRWFRFGGFASVHSSQNGFSDRRTT